MATTAIMTGAQFDALPYEEGRLWELVDGELIPMPSTTLEHQAIVQIIQVALFMHFATNRNQGAAFPDVEFALEENYRVRPDVFVLLSERAATVDRTKVPVPGSPDIAIEVISPSERASDTRQKLDAYLQHGTSEVWQIYPKSKAVMIHGGSSATTLTVGQNITTPLLPGFSLPVQSLF
jgi:Uma2 family endonuclease